jgi:hypothetical protein
MGEIIAISLLIAIGIWVRPLFISQREITSRDTLNSVYWQGIVMRILGTLLYIYYAFNLSDGSVDAFIYDNYAQQFAEYFIRGDLSPFTNKELYRGGELFYTNFVAYPAAFFLIITSNSTFGIYLLFSVVCFIGLVFLLKAFVLNYRFLNRHRVAQLILLFPALWFWTSTIGKDAFIFLGVGVICLGIHNNKNNYIQIIIGLMIIYAFRPPVAFMCVIALSFLFVLNTSDSPFWRVTKISLGLIVFLLLLNYLSAEWGVEDLSNESIMEFQKGTLHYNNFGAASLEEKKGGFASIPRGALDVLARPFLWESRNILSFASAIEINFVLLLLIIKRKSVILFFKNGLRHRLSTFVLAFLGVYVLSVGLFENNIGLIARHRAILFPFLFLIAFAYDESVIRVYQNLAKKARVPETV